MNKNTSQQNAPQKNKLSDFTVLSFDCYGTLIDWESGIWDAFQPLLAKNRRDDLPRATVLSDFATIESALQAKAPNMRYPELLAATHWQFAERYRLQSGDDLDQAFGESVAMWPAFADSAEALRLLKTKFKLVILSNVHRDGFAASNRKLGVAFDAVYTAEDTGAYKPEARNFAYMLERLQSDFGIGAHSVLHVAQSLFHDHVPACAVGLANAWIDRQSLSGGGSFGATAEVAHWPQVDFVFSSMMEFATVAVHS